MHACTVTPRYGLARVLVLAETLRAVHPAIRLTTLVADGLQGDAYADVPNPLCPAEIGISDHELRRMALAYDADELCLALRPRLLRHLRRSSPDDAIVFLDPSTVVYDTLEHVAYGALEHGLVLVPRLLTPASADGRAAEEAQLREAGLYEDGILAVGPGSDAFLDWWAQRLSFDGGTEDAIETPWLDFTPPLFEPLISRDLGLGVSAVNLHERSLSRSPHGVLLAGNVRLRTLSLRGYQPARPFVFDAGHRGSQPALFHRDPLLAEVVSGYGERVRALESCVELTAAYRYGTVANGSIPKEVRRLARHGLSQNGHLPPPPLPFGPNGDEAFVQWLNAPEASDGDSTVTRLLIWIWCQRADLQIAYPNPRFTHIRDLAAWARTAEDFHEEYRHLHHDTATPPGFIPRPLLPGLNVIGHLQAEFGLGEAGRLMAKAASSAGIPLRVVSRNNLPIRHLDPFAFAEHAAQGHPPFSVNLICTNGDLTPQVLAPLGRDLQRGPYRIGLWFWEVDEPYKGLDSALEFVDEIWVASEFVAGLFKPHTHKPVLVAPLAVIPPTRTHLRRADLGLPERRTVFLANFDFNSTPERKNPVGVVEAYLRAFSVDDGAHLLVKSINGAHRPDVINQLWYLTRDRPDIEIRDCYLSRTEMQALIQLSDAYVSLHRAEGFGLGPATSMAAGKPVIATGYSGNLSFMNPENSLLVPYEFVRVGRGVDVYPAEGRWAEPDVETAARHLRWVAEDPRSARALGARAQNDIERSHGLTVAGEWIHRRFNQILRLSCLTPELRGART